jgi:hypothetical protein
MAVIINYARLEAGLKKNLVNHSKPDLHNRKVHQSILK